jgi:hypothetical protein
MKALLAITLTVWLAGCTSSADRAAQNAAVWKALDASIELRTDCLRMEQQMRKEHRSELYIARLLSESGCK